MGSFTNKFQTFFNNLSQNNHSEWFQVHKNEYETHVKKPFEKLVGDLIKEISKYEDLGLITPKDCILRINKDVRFSKDKSPYNAHVTAFISKAGGKDKSIPGFFLRFSADSVGIMGGCYGPNTLQISQLRTHIQENLETFQNIKSNQEFVNKYGSLKGESIKRIPENLTLVALEEPLILNKQWYFVAEKDPTFMHAPQLLTNLMDYYFAAKPMNDFFLQALTK